MIAATTIAIVYRVLEMDSQVISRLLAHCNFDLLLLLLLDLDHGWCPFEKALGIFRAVR